MKYYSQYGQDAFLYNKIFAYKAGNGIFIDVGAYDGITFSNTYLFEKLGWTGICIEPDPSSFEVLKKTRNCILENCAISDVEREEDFYKLSGFRCLKCSRTDSDIALKE